MSHKVPATREQRTGAIHARTIAVTPTCPVTDPYDKPSAIVEAVAIPMCCNKLETKANMDARIVKYVVAIMIFG